MEGSFPIGARDVSSGAAFAALDAASGEPLEGRFAISTDTDLAEACRLAADAFHTYRKSLPEDRARFLETCAGEIERLDDEVIQRAHRETGLPVARLTGELGRTVAQLRLFARVVREGYWAGLTIDPALPERVPLPRPELRRMNIALGPVAVFGASNFPLAFSVAGGDTASALAAGCPVIVKAHPAHPGTSLLIARAIRRAVASESLPEGIFSMVQGPSNALGAALVRDPRIKAVGFTGSRAGGLALVAIAQSRPEPIPVYAEMSSVNPVVLMPAALAARGEALAQGYAASLAMGAGQFCTNPGIVLAVDGPDLTRFLAATAVHLSQVGTQVMLTKAICDNYQRGLAKAVGHGAVDVIVGTIGGAGDGSFGPALLSVSGTDFREAPQLAEEIFGPVSLVVRCGCVDEIASILEGLDGQLTATLQLDDADHDAASALIPIMETKVGRVLANGWPTGVEVSHAMVHGGPFPATSDARTTSVGAAAIERFLRPVCYQNFPEELLPVALREADPFGLPRYVS